MVEKNYLDETEESILKEIKIKPGITTTEISLVTGIDIDTIVTMLRSLAVRDKITFVNSGYGLMGCVNDEPIQ